MGTRGRSQATMGLVLVLATMALAAGCGSSSTVGTAGGPATTTPGALVADLSSCGRVLGTQISVAGGATGSASPTGALHDFLATNPTGRALRNADFEPAEPPPSDQPVQMVGQVHEPPHVGTDGRPSAIAGVVHMGSGGWIVTELELCQLGSSGGSTATTGTVPPPQVVPSADPPTSVTSIPPGGSTSTYPGLTTSSAVPGG